MALAPANKALICCDFHQHALCMPFEASGTCVIEPIPQSGTARRGSYRRHFDECLGRQSVSFGVRITIASTLVMRRGLVPLAARNTAILRQHRDGDAAQCKESAPTEIRMHNVIPTEFHELNPWLRYGRSQRCRRCGPGFRTAAYWSS